jgi:hypothetical protein
MRVNKCYCDVCGKEIEPDAHTKLILINKKIGKHGIGSDTIRIINESRGGVAMDFCEDCKATIALLFGGKSNE